jgi:hypothetical protein
VRRLSDKATIQISKAKIALKDMKALRTKTKEKCIVTFSK